MLEKYIEKKLVAEVKKMGGIDYFFWDFLSAGKINHLNCTAINRITKQ
jgi:hypothetical protein